MTNMLYFYKLFILKSGSAESGIEKVVAYFNIWIKK